MLRGQRDMGTVTLGSGQRRPCGVHARDVRSQGYFNNSRWRPGLVYFLFLNVEVNLSHFRILQGQRKYICELHLALRQPVCRLCCRCPAGRGVQARATD